MRVYTLGYGGRSKEEMLTLLQAHGVKTVVDIRIRPDRASMGTFVKAKSPDKGIKSWLAEAGIEYRSLVELGNLFLDFPDWKDRYREFLELTGELLTERLRKTPGPFCLLCAEKKVTDCHREEVANFLAVCHGTVVIHIE